MRREVGGLGGGNPPVLLGLVDHRKAGEKRKGECGEDVKVGASNKGKVMEDLPKGKRYDLGVEKWGKKEKVASSSALLQGCGQYVRQETKKKDRRQSLQLGKLLSSSGE